MAKTKIGSKISAGLLMYRIRSGALEVFLAHPGGPFFHKKDEGYWGIPKGLIDSGEDSLKAAIREFQEETGLAPDGEFHPLGEITQKSGKRVHAWGFAGDWPQGKKPEGNTFMMEWPPKSGRQRRASPKAGHKQEFPEIDRAEFFSIPDAQKKMIEAQQPFLERLAAVIGDPNNFK